MTRAATGARRRSLTVDDAWVATTNASRPKDAKKGSSPIPASERCCREEPSGSDSTSTPGSIVALSAAARAATSSVAEIRAASFMDPRSGEDDHGGERPPRVSHVVPPKPGQSPRPGPKSRRASKISAAEEALDLRLLERPRGLARGLAPLRLARAAVADEDGLTVLGPRSRLLVHLSVRLHVLGKPTHDLVDSLLVRSSRPAGPERLRVADPLA